MPSSDTAPETVSALHESAIGAKSVSCDQIGGAEKFHLKDSSISEKAPGSVCCATRGWSAIAGICSSKVAL